MIPDLLTDPIEVRAFRSAVVIFHQQTAAALAITPEAALESAKRLTEAAQRALAADAPLLSSNDD